MRNPDRKILGESFPHRTAVVCAAIATSLSIGWAWPAGADEPDSASDVSVPEQAPPDAEPGSPQPGSHAHDVGQPPDRSAKDWLKDVWTRDQLSGDWRGLRTDLNDHGVKPQIKYSQFGQGVASGGINRNFEYGGKLDYILDVDVSKLAGLWPGLFFNIHAQTQYGKSVLVDAGPSALPNTPMLVPLPNCKCTEVTNLVLMQGLWEGSIPLQEDKGAVVVAAGKLDIVDLLTTNFPNFGHGLDGFQNFSALYPAWSHLRHWFISQYGASVTLFNEDRGMPQFSFLVYGQDNVSAKWEISDSFSDGVGLMGFVRAFWDIGDKAGYVAVLASGSTKESSYVDGIDWQPPFPGFPPILPTPDIEEGNPWVVNPFIYQELWSGPDDGKHERKVYLWLAGSVADKAPSFARWSVIATVEALGPFASRPMDRMGLAGWYTDFNTQYEDGLRALGFSPRNIYGFELYYNLAINPWLHLTADLQLAQNIDKNDDFVVIPGFRLLIEF
jgi:porin